MSIVPCPNIASNLSEAEAEAYLKCIGMAQNATTMPWSWNCLNLAWNVYATVATADFP